VLNFRINININIIEQLIKELKILNDNLYDIKKMIAPFLGYRIIDKNKKEE
jgi:hypothetical protein